MDQRLKCSGETIKILGENMGQSECGDLSEHDIKLQSHKG